MQSSVFVQVFHLNDVDLWLVLSVLVFHPSQCEMTVVRLDAVV
jgi:hypothetical protein